MVYSGIIVTEAQIVLMSGENVDATGATEANHNDLAAQAEAYLSMLMRYDVATNWTSLKTVERQLLSEWAARYAGMALIAYNMAGFTTRIEAEDMINIHVWRMLQIEKILNQNGVDAIQT